MNSEQTALVARMDGFLAKIFGRQKELMAEAEQGLLGLAAQYPDDSQPMGNAIGALDHRMMQLRERIQEAWDGKIDDQFSSLGDGAFLDVGLDRKGDAEMKLEHEWQTFKANTVTRIYREMWPRVQAALAESVGCSQCGSPLQTGQTIKIVNASCPHCGTANQVVPAPVVTNYFGPGVHAFADAAALPLRHEIDRFREQVDRQRRASSWKPESVESLERWNEMERACWMKFAETQAQITGEPPDLALVESRMTSFRKYSLETDQRWRAKHGP
jgi:hypothetical protein